LSYNRKHITVFEHQSIKLDQVIDGVKFDVSKLKAFESYFGNMGVPYFSLINKGIRFNEYVGVIQVGDTIIEVLPKADYSFAGNNDKKQWQGILLDMLYEVGIFDIHAPSSSSLKLKNNSILDLYFEFFIKEVEYLLHQGLIKQYRRKEGNVTALKGNLHFGKHLQQNITHQERFYVRHTTYDVEHKLHLIIYKTIRLLKQINTNVGLHSRIGNLLLLFPDMPEIKVTEKTFDNLVFTRKNISYKTAIDIAKLLLLKYHPDVLYGKNDILALMFDMNILWEKFVYVSLRKNKELISAVSAQTSKYFWQPETGYRSKIKPDIVINKDKVDCIVLDTKWKNLNGYNPSPDDLRQMYVYHEYFGAKRVALVYPGNPKNGSKGVFYPTKIYNKMDKECSVILLEVPKTEEANKSIIKIWKDQIGEQILKWLN